MKKYSKNYKNINHSFNDIYNYFKKYNIFTEDDLIYIYRIINNLNTYSDLRYILVSKLSIKDYLLIEQINKLKLYNFYQYIKWNKNYFNSLFTELYKQYLNEIIDEKLLKKKIKISSLN